MLVAEKRIANFEKMGLGLFVHFGLYSQLAVGEWVFSRGERTMEEYSKLQETFTAEDFDAEKLVQTAKCAGCKYIVLTTRHHEGFSLFDVKGLNDFDSLHSPAKRDIVREFADACRKYDVMPFFYHTTLDWYNEDFENNFDAYLDYLRSSIEILCTNYGKVGGFWFDGDWSKPDSDWKLDELYGTIRKYQPDAMIINNTGLDARGEIGHPEIDSVTFEQGRPTPMDRTGMSKYVAAEMCYTMNCHWGVGYDDLDYKSPRELIEALCDCRKVGANLLLNIGPTAQGGIVPIQEEYLKLVGRWMEFFGEAVYQGKPYTICENSKNFVLKGDDGSLYFFVYDLGRVGSPHVVQNSTDGLHATFPVLDDTVTEIYWMDNGEKLDFKKTEGTLSIACTGYPYGTHYCVRVAKGKI